MVWLLIKASIWTVRKIRAHIAEGEQAEKPIFTPCGVIGFKKEQLTSGSDPPAAVMTPEPDDGIANGGPAASETAVQKCGSWG